MADFRKVVRHKRTKSVIETRLYYQILAKFEYAKRSGSNNAHATDIYYPERENYIPRKREWLLLIHLRGQCEKPDSVDEQDTVLTLFALSNFAVPTEDEGHVSKTMRTIHIKKYVVAVLAIIFICSCTNAQTFVVTDIAAPDNIPEKHVQEAQKKVIGTEVYLLFSDNDVRMTAKPKGEKAESMVLQKIGDDLYRGEDGHEVLDLELNTLFSYIKSCKITIYDKKHSGSSMVWAGTMILKRK